MSEFQNVLRMTARERSHALRVLSGRELDDRERRVMDAVAFASRTPSGKFNVRLWGDDWRVLTDALRRHRERKEEGVA